MFRWFKSLLAAALALVPGFQVARAGEPAAQGRGQQNRMAFVLLREPVVPKATSVVDAYARIAPAASRPVMVVEAPPKDGKSPPDVLAFDLGKDGTLLVMLVPSPVPKGEADEHARWSLLGATKGWKPEPHKAHAIVLWQQAQALPAVESARHFTWMLAAVAQASAAVGIYWGDSGATHPVDYFVQVAGQEGNALLATLWSGISIAADGGDPNRMSVVTVGMSQVGLLDLEVTAPRSRPMGETVTFMMDLLGYALTRGKVVPQGETVGRTADERLTVRHAPSPVDPKKRVWRVDLPAPK